MFKDKSYSELVSRWFHANCTDQKYSGYFKFALSVLEGLMMDWWFAFLFFAAYIW